MGKGLVFPCPWILLPRTSGTFEFLGSLREECHGLSWAVDAPREESAKLQQEVFSEPLETGGGSTRLLVLG